MRFYFNPLGRVHVSSIGTHKCIGIDVVTALEYVQKHPYLADDPYFDCIRPHVNLMLSHQKEVV